MTTFPNSNLIGWNFARKRGLRRIFLRTNNLGNNFEPVKVLMLGRIGKVLKMWDGVQWNRIALWNQENKFGSSTDYVHIDVAGNLSLEGTATVFDDLRVVPDVKGTGAKDPSWTVWLGGLYVYDFNDAAVASEKEVWFSVQMPHGWKEGSTLSPHVHWTNKSAGTAGQVVRWGLEYAIAQIGGTFPATTTIYGTSIVGGGDITVANEHLLTELPDVVMTGHTISTIIYCRLFRNSSDAADTFGGTAGLLSIDWHYEINKMGSQTEYT